MERSKAEKILLRVFQKDDEELPHEKLLQKMQAQMAKDEAKFETLLFESKTNLHSVLNHVSTIRLERDGCVACHFASQGCTRLCKIKTRTFTKKELQGLQDEKWVVPRRANDEGLFGSKVEVADYLKSQKALDEAKKEFKLHFAVWKGDHSPEICNYADMMFPWAESTEESESDS